MRARGKKRRRGRRVIINNVRHDRFHLVVLLCGICCVVMCYSAVVFRGITKVAWVLGAAKHGVRNEKVMIFL